MCNVAQERGEVLMAVLPLLVLLQADEGLLLALYALEALPD